MSPMMMPLKIKTGLKAGTSIKILKPSQEANCKKHGREPGGLQQQPFVCFFVVAQGD